MELPTERMNDWVPLYNKISAEMFYSYYDIGSAMMLGARALISIEMSSIPVYLQVNVAVNYLKKKKPF